MRFFSRARPWIVSLVVMASLPAHGQSITDAFDKLDSDEFMAAIEKGKKCASLGDFICSDKSFALAARLAATQQNKAALQQAVTQAADKKKDAAVAASTAEELSSRQAQESRTRQQQIQQQQRQAAKARAQENERVAAEAERAVALSRTSDLNQILQNQARVSAELSRSTRDIQAARQDARAADQERTEKAQERNRSREQQLALAREQPAQHSLAEQRRTAADAQTRRDELAEKQRRQTERADREAKIAAEHAAEQAAKKNYLAEMIRGTRLKASKCPDGAGHYYASGSRPNVKPEAVACIDIHFEARCRAGNTVSRGVAHNFIGMSGCFGDTYQIEPKPACPVSEVDIKVTDAQPCA